MVLTDSTESKHIIDTSHYKHIMFIDCDGVLCDGVIYLDHQRARKFNLRDGHGFQLLDDNGVLSIIMSGEDDVCQHHRAEKLSVPFFGGVKGKLDRAKLILRECKNQGWEPDKLAFISDDIYDLPLLMFVDFPGCPADAHKDLIYKLVQLPALYEGEAMICENKGGQGAFREFAEGFINYLTINNNH